MKEKTLLKTALITSLIGIFLLHILSNTLETTENTISKITSEEKGNKMKIKGYVGGVTNLEKVMFIKIVQPESIDVLIFKESNESYDLQANDYIEVIGKAEEYNGEMEIIASRIRKVR